MVVEFLLLKKHYEKEETEMTKNYTNIMKELKNECECKIEMFKHEPVKVIELHPHIQEYKKCIELEDHFYSRFTTEQERDEWLRREFGRCFAEEVLEPSMNIKEVFDPMSTHRKYITKIYVAFKEE